MVEHAIPYDLTSKSDGEFRAVLRRLGDPAGFPVKLSLHGKPLVPEEMPKRMAASKENKDKKDD